MYALVFLKHGTRRLHITGVTARPTRNDNYHPTTTNHPPRRMTSAPA
ncbi:hypothetical protein [Streptomyces sp. BRA346]